jgi:hypothetical protein
MLTRWIGFNLLCSKEVLFHAILQLCIVKEHVSDITSKKNDVLAGRFCDLCPLNM